MKLQDVILKALAKKPTRTEAAEIAGMSVQPGLATVLAARVSLTLNDGF
ncbi:MAG TPA: hypothetical protein VMH80_22080 [Bryobacteraceae bacterium]|nr:hypothetical protein [Bryobacteraceae bacterium]